MATLRERLASELDKLVEEGFHLLKDLTKEEPKSFRVVYQQWYTRALGAIRELVPDRLQEFIQLYQIEKRKTFDIDTYAIHDFMLGRELDILFEPDEMDEKGIVAMR
ncbi:MAG: hypothetical protein ACE5JO_12480, partial [Candidatus Binatia bacterium]